MAGQIFTVPPATPSDGKYSFWWVPTVADVNAIKVSEVNIASAIPLQCYGTGDGLQVTLDEQVIEDERMCSTQKLKLPGRKEFGLEFTYIDNTNSEDLATDSNKAADTLVEGATGVVVTRRNVNHDAPAAADQTYRAYPVRAGVKQEVPLEANSTTKSKTVLYPSGEAAIDKKFVAGP